MGRVAIITRTKDRPLMLPRAQQSVVNQTYKDMVWVLVNDGGRRNCVDSTATAARDAGVEVHVVHHEASTGMQAASNTGVRAVDSEFIVIHDDDDSWEPEFLARSTEFLDQFAEYLGVTCISHAVYERLEKDSVVELRRTPYNAHLQNIQIADMALENQFAPISFVFRRTAYNDLNGFDENLTVLGDWDFNLRMLLKGDIGLLPEVLANYHIRESVATDQSIYGNSITEGINIHMVEDAYYRNLKLREDLSEGVVGLGFMLCQGRQLQRITRNVDFMAKVARLPQKAWGRVRQSLRKEPLRK